MASRGRQACYWLTDWCRSYFEEYWAANNNPLKIQTQVDVKWSPIFPSYKINVDAAIFSTQKAAGVGVLIRDHEGNFIAGLSKKTHAPLGIIDSEAKAFETGIIFAKEVGIREFILEGDSLTIVQVLKECSPAPSSVSNLVYGMLAECNEFRNVSFSHVR